MGNIRWCQPSWSLGLESNDYDNIISLSYLLSLHYPSSCQQCSSANKFAWTNNNNLRCSDGNIRTKNDRCLNGACVGTLYSCLQRCEDYTGSGCQHNRGCVILYNGARRCFNDGDLKPDNECYVSMSPSYLHYLKANLSGFISHPLQKSVKLNRRL